MTKAVGPLDGIRVIDMTSILMGPYAAQLMGDMGADVIKVESPQGDMVREILERDLVSEVQKSSLMQRAVMAWRQMRGAL